MHDRDLRIENNYRQRDYNTYFGGDIAPDFLARGRDGEIYSIHAPGLPALVLPAFALLGYRGVEAFLLLLAAITGSLVWRIAWRATDDVASAWFAWAAVVGSATFLLHSFAVFPDAPGALVVAASILLLFRLSLTPEAVGPRALVAVSFLLAAMPWLHTRFVVLSAGLGLAVAWRVLADPSRSAGLKRRRAAIFLLLPCASAVAWFGFFQWIYGTPNPAAPYGNSGASRATYVPGGLAGLLFDEQFGLLAYAPVLAFAIVGLFRTTRAAVRVVAGATTAVAVLYLAAVSTYWLWWAGSPANPARFAVAVLPALAVPLATAWSGAAAERRRMMSAILAISLAISAVVTAQHGDLAWNMRNAEARWLDWLGPVSNLPRGWPSFFWTLDPASLRSEWPFVIHVIVWLAIFVAGWEGLRRLGRQRGWSSEAWRFALSCWICGGAMVAIQAGWWLTGATGLDPAPSQVTVLAAGGPLLEIAPLSLHRLAAVNGRMSIVSEESGRLDASPPWLVLDSVPAGAYELRVSTTRPRAGVLLVFAGHASAPIRRLFLKPLNRQTLSLDLPIGAPGLVILPDADIERVSGSIELRPMQVIQSRRLPKAAMSYGATTVYFLDDNVFTEAGGFWVRGGAVAEMVLEGPGGPEGFVLAHAAKRPDGQQRRHCQGRQGMA